MADAEANNRQKEPTGASQATNFTSSSGHEAKYVKPSDLLRLQTRPAPKRAERPIDRDERRALRAIRDFLRVRTSYDVLPLSFRLIIFDTALTIKESLNILVQNGASPLVRLCMHTWVADYLAGIVSAPLWDSRTSTFAGLLTTSDYINVIQYYWQNPTKLSEIDAFTLSSLRDVERDIGARPPETVSINPQRPLYEACRKLLTSRARRIPLISCDSQTGRTMVTSVITQYRILKFVAVNVGDTQNLRKPLKDIKLGTYDHLVKCSMDSIVLDVIHWMVKHNISSVPIVTAEGILLNVFEAVDVIMLIKGGDYDSLQLTVGEALRKRPDDYPGIYTCSPEDGLDTIFETIRKSRVHRLMVIDNDNSLLGVLSLSDILQYILLEGEHEDVGYA